MKTLKFLLLAIAVVTFAACSSDDDSNDDGGVVQVELTNANLAGTYNLTFVSSTSETTVNATGGQTVVTEREVVTTDTFTNAEFVFTANGTFSSSGNYRESTTTTVTGTTPVTEVEIVTLTDMGTFSVSNINRTITLNIEDGMDTFQIVADVVFFDGTNLTVTGSITDTDNGATTVEVFERRFVKQ